MKALLLFTTILTLAHLSFADTGASDKNANAASDVSNSAKDSGNKNAWGESGSADAPNGGPAIPKATDGKYAKNPYHKMGRSKHQMNQMGQMQNGNGPDMPSDTTPQDTNK